MYIHTSCLDEKRNPHLHIHRWGIVRPQSLRFRTGCRLTNAESDINVQKASGASWGPAHSGNNLVEVVLVERGEPLMRDHEGVENIASFGRHFAPGESRTSGRLAKDGNQTPMNVFGFCHQSQLLLAPRGHLPLVAGRQMRNLALAGR